MDITSLLGNVMDKDMLEKLSKSANVSTTDVSNVLKNAAPSVMKHLDEMRPGVLRTTQSAGVCFEPTPGLSDTVDLAGPYMFRRDIQFQAFGCLKCRAIVLRYEED